VGAAAAVLVAAMSPVEVTMNFTLKMKLLAVKMRGQLLQLVACNSW
jgi:hypothetical protein